MTLQFDLDPHARRANEIDDMIEKAYISAFHVAVNEETANIFSFIEIGALESAAYQVFVKSDFTHLLFDYAKRETPEAYRDLPPFDKKYVDMYLTRALELARTWIQTVVKKRPLYRCECEPCLAYIKANGLDLPFDFECLTAAFDEAVS